jgi:uncharacterized protein (TIGR03066 family)
MKKTFSMIMMLALVAILGACGNSNSNTPSNDSQGNASIIGKWEGVRMTQNGEPDENGTKFLQHYSCEFREDGTLQWFVDGAELGTPDTYTLEGDQLTIKASSTMKYTVTTLTKKKFVREQVIGGDTQAEEFQRIN